MTRHFYTNLKDLGSMTDPNKSIEEIITQESNMDLVIARVFKDFECTVFSIANKYFTIDQPSKDSIIMESILTSINKFDASRGYKFHTLLYTVTSNAFKRVLSYQEAKTKNRRWHLDAKSIDGDNVIQNSSSGTDDAVESTEMVQNESQANCFINVEYLADVKVSSLTDEEYKVALLIIEGFTGSQICEILQIDRYFYDKYKQGIEDVLILDELCVQ